MYEKLYTDQYISNFTLIFINIILPNNYEVILFIIIIIMHIIKSISMHKLKKLINYQKSLTTSSSQFFTEIPRKKDTDWIYSTKYQQKQFRKPGLISLYSHINADTHNTSIRFIQHLQRAHIILTNQPQFTHKFLQSIQNKLRYIQRTQQVDSKQLQKYMANTSLQEIKTQIDKKTLQYETELQISKMIQLQKQQKNKGVSSQRNNTKLASSSRQLKQYMNVKYMDRQLSQIKAKQGYPAIFSIYEFKKNTQQQNYNQQILKLQEDGFNIFFVFSQKNNSISASSQIIKALQQQKLPYEILPCSDQLITAIVSSGLPADRFSVEIHPSEDIESLLKRRANMKITTCIQLQTSRLDMLVQDVIRTLGKQHIVYLHGEKYYRGEVFGLVEYLKNQQNYPKSQQSYLILAPMVVQFNQNLKKQQNIKSHIIGQLQSQKLNVVEMEILGKKLKQLEKKEEVYQIDCFLMAGELLGRLRDQELVRGCLRKMLGRMKEEELNRILEEGKKYVVVDYIGIKNNEPVKSKNMKKEDNVQN